MAGKTRLASGWWLALIVSALMLTAAVAVAEEHRGPVTLLRTVPIPNSPLVVFDISWVDPDSQRYYLADRSNAVIDVIDARHDTFVRQIHGGFTGFTGCNDTSGPNGVVVSGHWLFVTDAPSRVVTIDLRTDTIVGEVSTGGGAGLRADELAYDPQDGLLLVVNNADSPPFATLVQVDTHTGKLTLGQRITFAEATNGAEQPVWDRQSRRFYLTIPEVNGPGGTGPDGAVARINPKTAAVETMLPVRFCQPAGLALGPRQDLLLGCSVPFDTAGNAWTATDTNSAAPISVIMDARTCCSAAAFHSTRRATRGPRRTRTPPRRSPSSWTPRRARSIATCRACRGRTRSGSIPVTATTISRRAPIPEGRCWASSTRTA